MKEQMAYFTDVYCGWCYGFHHHLLTFLKDHPAIELSVIPSGLFAGSRVKPIGELTQIPSINQSIQEIYQVDFSGQDRLFQEGAYRMNSDHPSAILALIKHHTKGSAVLKALGLMQEAFFKDGKPLDQVATYLPIIQDIGLADQIGKDDLAKALENPELAYEEYRKARALGVESYPTLAIAHNGGWYKLKGQDMEDLQDNYHKIINLPLKSFGCIGC